MHKSYLLLQFKRIFKLYPEILKVTFFTILAVLLVCGALLMNSMQGEEKKKLTIGVVGNADDPYISIGIEAIKNYDSSQFYLDVINMDEKTAKEALEKREISGYIYIPDGYIRNIFRGNNNPAKYVVLNSPEGFGTIISGEVTKVASYVVTESQAGMYSMQEISDDFQCDNKRENINKMMLHYVNVILSRNELYETQELGLYDSVSTGGYYISGMILLLMLLWGISCSKVFSSRKLSLSEVLHASGMTISKQLTCEYIPFLSISFLTLLMILLPAGAVVSLNDFGIRELAGTGVSDSILFALKIFPVVVLITMLQTTVYEVISNSTGAVLGQFLITIGLGYICGLFYPASFFPEALQNFAMYLPTGVGFKYIREALLSELKFSTFIMVVIYAAIFALITIFMRKHRIEGGAK